MMFSEGINIIEYFLWISPSNQANIYSEKICRNGKLVFSSDEKYLLNEKSEKQVENFFIPNNIPAISSIKGSDFPTISLINNFLSRILLITSNKYREVNIDENAFIPDSNGTNLSSVLFNWKKSYEDIYNDVEQDFIACYKYIKGFKFQDTNISGLKAKFLSFREMEIDRNISIIDWSDGLYRALHLIMAPKVPFKINEETYTPSLVLIDEVENGLDYKTLRYISNYLNSYADESQLIISSHSPLVCDFVLPKNWLIASRKGVKLNFVSPEIKEEDLNKALNIFKHDHWNFYKEHISVSPDYGNG